MTWPWFYDLAVYPLELLGLSRQRKSLMVQVTGRVLEIGGGTGVNLPYYGCNCRLVLTDPHEALLRRAAKRRNIGPRTVTLAAADAQRLPFQAASFDIVVATLAFCTIPQPAMAFREAHRVLRPTGKLLLLEHVRAPQPWMARLQNILTPSWRILADGCHLNRDTLGVAAASGFQIVRKRYGLGGVLLTATLIACPSTA
ncbi:MAG: class I SAM-dependent methyltransferase [Planctomycetes bacterium]|nr:class I SAM-dependent methyltransferase [Planctomycetota bacterium]